MTAMITLYQANEVFKVLRALLFEIFEFFAFATGIFTAKTVNLVLTRLTLHTAWSTSYTSSRSPNLSSTKPHTVFACPIRLPLVTTSPQLTPKKPTQTFTSPHTLTEIRHSLDTITCQIATTNPHQPHTALTSPKTAAACRILAAK